MKVPKNTRLKGPVLCRTGWRKNASLNANKTQELPLGFRRAEIITNNSSEFGSIKQNFTLCNNKRTRFRDTSLQFSHPSAGWQKHRKKWGRVRCAEKIVSVWGLQTTPYPNATVSRDYVVINSMLLKCLLLILYLQNGLKQNLQAHTCIDCSLSVYILKMWIISCHYPLHRKLLWKLLNVKELT